MYSLRYKSTDFSNPKFNDQQIQSFSDDARNLDSPI